MSLSVSQIVKKIRKEFDLSQKELAEILKINPQRISDIETGKVKNLKMEEVTTLVNKYNINPLFINTGEGELFEGNSGAIIGINNGNISINTSSFNHGRDIKDIIELLGYASPQYLNTIKLKLEEFKKMSEE